MDPLTLHMSALKCRSDTAKCSSSAKRTSCVRKESTCSSSRNRKRSPCVPCSSCARVKIIRGPPGHRGPPGPDGKRGPDGEPGPALFVQQLLISTQEENSFTVSEPVDILTIDTRQVAATVTLLAPAQPGYIRLRMFDQRGLPITIRLVEDAGFELNPSIPDALFFWNGTLWVLVENVDAITGLYPNLKHDAILSPNTLTVPSIGSKPFGLATSASGTTVVAGGPNDEGEKGYVYVFDKDSNDGWFQTARLRGLGDGQETLQGEAVALSADGNTLAFGCTTLFSGQGGVWIFNRNNGTWTETALLSDAAYPGAGQGKCLALSADGKMLIVGAPDANEGQGVVHVWANQNGSWGLFQTLNQHTVSQGASVAINATGEIIAFGAPQEAGGGRVYVGKLKRVYDFGFEVISYELTRVYGGALGEIRYEGVSVALSADGYTLATGSPTDPEGGAPSTIKVYKCHYGEWLLQAILTSPDAGDFVLGSNLALTADGNTLLTGVPGKDTIFGGIYVFRRLAGNWSFYQKALTLVLDPPYYEGTSIALSSDANIAVASQYAAGAGALVVYQ